MERTRRRGAVVAVLAATAVLAPAAAFGGYAAGRELAGGPGAVEAPSAPASAPAAPSAASSPSQRATELSDAARELAARTAVRLADPGSGYFGSGSIVSADGLVLTNAHVADPTAPGLSALYGTDANTYAAPPAVPYDEPAQLVVSVSEGDGPAEPAYLADVLVVDGYLDLAVLRIVATPDGSPLQPGTRFPAIPLGTVDDLQKGDGLTVYGYPDVNGGDLLSVAPGAVRTFIPDRLGRVDGARFDIETTAEFSNGNSGGMALDDDGRLVGIPRGRLVRSEPVEVSRKARPVDFAAPLLEAARRGATYASPYLVPATGKESAQDLGWTDEESCSSDPVEALATSDQVGLGRVALSGLNEDEDVLLVLRRDGEVVQTLTTSFEAAQPCYGISIDPGEDETLVAGAYRLEVRVGPQRVRLLTSEVTVEPAGD